MTTTIMDAARLCADRIDLSEQVIAAWESRPGEPIGQPEDDLTIISNEGAILRRLATERPRDADRAGALIARYQAMADRVRADARG